MCSVIKVKLQSIPFKSNTFPLSSINLILNFSIFIGPKYTLVFDSIVLSIDIISLMDIGFLKGIIANILLSLLIFNLVLITAVMSLIGATLTLPGIAGIVLTVGMAVDANVLIFARISEEIRSNSEVQLAIKNGFSKAFGTIMDANITTLLVALILYAIGTGPIKGFAITLSIGIVTSIFTAILVTRGIVNIMYGYRKVERLNI